MNDLNSTIIEGTITSIEDTDSNKVFKACIVSHHTVEDTPMIIRTEEHNAVMCHKLFPVGRRVSVVGRLRYDKPDYYVDINHIESK